MTADKSMENTGLEQEQGTRKNGARKSSRKKSTRGATAKRSRAAASRRTAASRSSKTAAKARSGRTSSSRSGSRKSGSASSGIASRLVSRSRRAAGNAYEWAAEGASRAIPLASRSMPDQRTVQRLVDERPYMLGALGLGIGAMIGLMLPSPLHMKSFSRSSSGKSRR